MREINHMEKPIRLFISYSHDSKNLMERVLHFSDKLRKDGIDCNIDQYESFPPEGWPIWMHSQINESDFILIVCSKGYLDKLSGKLEGLGVNWEGAIITQELYENIGLNTKFIPLILETDDKKFIPTILKSYTFYQIDFDYEKLYRYITKQPEIRRPKLGKFKSLPPKKRRTNFSKDFRKTEIVDIISICRSFPEIAPVKCCPSELSSFVQRDNFLDSIDTIFEGDTLLIGVEGEEGIGKTYLLTQYILRKKERSICLFIKPTSRWGYDPETVRFDLCNQINWLLSQEEINTPDVVNDSLLRGLILRLQRLAKYKTYYFIIDGLEEIADSESYIREIIIDMLPIGLPNFRFLVTGEPEKLFTNKRKSLLTKSFPLPGFTFGETEKFFTNFHIGRDSLEEIHRTCKKTPGKLAAVKRILESGVNVNDLLLKISDKLPDFFEIEWAIIEGKGQLIKRILAIIAHDRRRHSIDDWEIFYQQRQKN